MSEFLGTAFVSIQSELAKGFRANLREQVLKSVGSGYKIPIKADIQPFRKQLQAEARKGPILVPVKPGINTREFRRELQKKITTATTGMRIRVPVDVVGGVGTGTAGGAGGSGGGTGGGRGQTAQQRALADAVGRTAQAEGLLKRAREQNITGAERLVRLNEALGASQRSIESLLRQEAVARDLNQKKLVSGLAVQREKVEATYAEALAERDLLKTQISQAAVQNAATEAKARAANLLAVEVGSIKSRDRLQQHSNALLSVEAELNRVSAAARKAGLADLERETAALARNAAAREAGITTRRQELASETAGRGRRAQTLRGATATGLSFGGIRGATLAAGGPFLAGAAGVAIVAKLASQTAEFTKELSVLRATADATAEEMEAVSAAATRLGADIRLPAVSAADAVIAMTELSKAGLSVQDSIAGAEGVLQLATAAQISNADAAKLAANALNSFGLAGDQAVRVADDLANAANAAQGEIVDIGIAMSQSSAVARQVGLSLEDTISLLSLLAKNGVQGSDAGTSLRTALIRLISPTKQAAAEIKRLGLEIRDSEQNLRADVFAQFGEATRDLPPAVRDASAALIFGQDAIRAVAIGAREGADGLRLMQYEIDQSGTAAEVAAARTTGLSGSISGLKSNVSTFGIGIGGLVTGPLKTLADSLSNSFALATNVVEGLKEIGKVKIPPIVIPFSLKREGGQGEGFDLGDVVGTVLDYSLFGNKGPIGQLGKQAAELNKEIEKLTTPKSVLEARNRLKELNDQLRALQKSRLQVAKVGRFDLAEGLTEDIERVKKQIAGLKSTVEGVEVKPLEKVRKALADLREIRETRISLGLNTTNVDNAIKGLKNQLDVLKLGGAFVMDPLNTGLKNTVTAADLASAALARTAARVRELNRESVIFSDQLLKIQSEGGTNAEQIAVLRRDNATQRAIIAAAQEGGNQSGDATKIREARAKIISNNAQIESLQNEIASANKEAADNAEAAAKKAEDERERLDRGILATFAANRQKAENKLAIAQATAGLEDDIRATVFLKRLVRLQISRLKERVKTAEIRNEAYRELSQTLFGLNQELAAMRAEHRQTIRDEIRRGLELDIEFAETTENAGAERRARLALIKSLEKEAAALRAVKRKTIEQKNRLKEIRNEIAAQRKELQDISRERQRMFQELSFSFLTTQQGFAANLLGNLLPMGAIGGTVGARLSGAVGGSGGSGGAGSDRGAGRTNLPAGVLRGDRGGPPLTPSAALEESGRVSAARAVGGFSAAQAATLIQLTRMIVELLGGIDAKGRHPENKRERRITSGSFDKMQ